MSNFYSYSEFYDYLMKLYNRVWNEKDVPDEIYVVVKPKSCIVRIISKDDIKYENRDNRAGGCCTRSILDSQDGSSGCCSADN